MTITAPIRVISESNARDHFHAKNRRAKAQRLELLVAIGRRSLTPPPVVVTLVRVAPRALDDDNLRSAFKALRDELAIRLGLPTNKAGIADDRDPRVRWTYDQTRGKPGEYAVRVEIRPMEPIEKTAWGVA